jgi:hypothetical protein
VTRNDASPPEPGSAYPAEPVSDHLLECQVCGATFEIVDRPGDGQEIADTAAFLRRHRRCLRRTLDYGGVLAKPVPRRRR